MKIYLLLSFLHLIVFSFAQDKIDDQYKIFDTQAKQFVTIDKMIDGCAVADVLFFGEEHNDSIGHYLKHKILRKLYSKSDNKLALSLEMFETDGQLGLNEYLSGFITEDRFSKDVRLWNNYKDYKPMIEFARNNKLDVIAANPPRRYVSLVTRRGMKSLDSLSKDAKKLLPPLPYDTLSGRYREKFMETMKGSPGGSSSNIYYSQSLWDAGMSYSIYKYHKKNKRNMIFHCVGRFHSDEKLGTLAHLQKRKPKLKILNISCFSDAAFADPAATGWEKFSNLGDYVIITNPDLKKTF